MQMHPDDKSYADQYLYRILEHNKFIGLGQWDKGESTISQFKKEMSVNDIVAIKNGANLIALVQIIGGAYELHEDVEENTTSKTKWIIHRRPIRVLDWELRGEKLPQPRGTLEKCSSNTADTTRIITEWHKRVEENFKKRDLPTSV